MKRYAIQLNTTGELAKGKTASETRKKKSDQKRIEELEARLAETERELHAVKMLKCCYQTIVRLERERIKDADRYTFWDITAQEDRACARFFREMGNESTEAYCLNRAERHEWVRDNPEEVKRRAAAVRQRLREKAGS